MSRPRALVLTTRLPWPLDDGGHIANYQSLWSISRDYETTLLSFVPPPESSATAPGGLDALGIRLVRVAHRPPWKPIALLQGVCGKWPYMLARYRSAEYEATLRRLVTELSPDLVFINALHLATYRDVLGGLPVVMRTQNLEHLWLARYADRLANPAARLYARDQARRLEATEAALCSRCDMVLAISEEEAAVLRRLAPRTPVEAVPVGIDLGRYRPRAPEQPPIVAMIGSWNWAPNEDGGRAFLEHGWPTVLRRRPDARLRLVGKQISHEFGEFARRAGAEVVGYVDDTAAEFARASALVVPLWMGAGVRVKIVEALAARLPVVSTPLGAEGLGVTHGVHVTLGGTPQELGEAIGGVLDQPGRARDMAESGRRFAEENFSLEAVARRTLSLCARVTRGRNSSRRSSA